MAEFIEVMKWQKMMCEVDDTDCDECKLHYNHNGKNVACGDFVWSYPEEAEKLIMEWAAARPEPKYPSWNEAWKQLFPDSSLCVQLPFNASPCPKYFLPSDRVNCKGTPCCDCTDKPIPADIAEKLGIKPLEE